MVLDTPNTTVVIKILPFYARPPHLRGEGSSHPSTKEKHFLKKLSTQV